METRTAGAPTPALHTRRRPMVWPSRWTETPRSTRFCKFTRIGKPSHGRKKRTAGPAPRRARSRRVRKFLGYLTGRVEPLRSARVHFLVRGRRPAVTNLLSQKWQFQGRPFPVQEGRRSGREKVRGKKRREG